MITEQDLQEAIAECEGQRNPNANTCIKLAAFYTIREHMFPEKPPESPYSFAPPPSFTQGDAGERYESETEFGKLAGGMDSQDVIAVMDELMTALSVVNPRLYAGTLRKLEETAT